MKKCKDLQDKVLMYIIEDRYNKIKNQMNYYNPMNNDSLGIAAPSVRCILVDISEIKA